MEKKVEVSNSGIGLAGILTIIFVVLRLTDIIAWSWWWVFSPLWISAVITVGIFVIIGFIATLTRR